MYLKNLFDAQIFEYMLKNRKHKSSQQRDPAANVVSHFVVR